MALKKLDFKQLLLEKGEKIGLGIGAGLGVLLIVWFGLSVATGNSSPGANVAQLRDLKTTAENKWRNSKPTPDLEKLPPELQAIEQKRVDAEAFPTPMTYFAANQGEDLKWRLPKVLAPDEFAVNVVNAAIQAYLMDFVNDKDKPQVAVLKAKATADQTKMTRQQIEQWRNALNRKTKKISSTPGQSVMQTPPPAPPPSAPLAPTQGGRGGPPQTAGGKGGGGMMNPEQMQSMMGREGRTVYDQELGWASLDKLEDNAKLAQTNIPRRMIIVTAAFPYKQQLEEYRKAMRYGSVEEMLLDPTAARPEFIGFNVQRRKYNPEGKMVDDWTDIDVLADMRRLDMQAVDREPEPQRLVDLGIIVYPNAVVTPLPLLARGQPYPQPKLESIEKTQEDMLKAMQAHIPPPPKQASRFDRPLFDAKRKEDSPTTTPQPVAAGAKGSRPTEMTLSSASPGSLAIPEKCLVRFVDADRGHRAGYSYEYRIQILMSNPCHEKPERSISKTYSKDEAVEGPWQDVAWMQDGKPATRVTVPEELHYYVVDERAATANKERAFVQIHRWLEETPTKADAAKTEVPVGDWAIIERRQVQRGEYVGRFEEVEVTTWNPTLERFIIAVHPTELKKGRIRRHSGIPVDFSGGDEKRPLVVDFDGGEHTFTVNGRQVRDSGPVEMLIRTADGRLVVRNSRQDTDSAERTQRVSTWKAWLDRVRSQGDDKPENRDNLFPTAPGGKGGSG